jgi:hypothetical protein
MSGFIRISGTEGSWGNSRWKTTNSMVAAYGVSGAEDGQDGGIHSDHSWSLRTPLRQATDRRPLPSAWPIPSRLGREGSLTNVGAVLESVDRRTVVGSNGHRDNTSAPDLFRGVVPLLSGNDQVWSYSTSLSKREAEQLAHLCLGAEFAVSPGVMRVFDTLHSEPPDSSSLLPRPRPQQESDR